MTDVKSLSADEIRATVRCANETSGGKYTRASRTGVAEFIRDGELFVNLLAQHTLRSVIQSCCYQLSSGENLVIVIIGEFCN